MMQPCLVADFHVCSFSLHVPIPTFWAATNMLLNSNQRANHRSWCVLLESQRRRGGRSSGARPGRCAPRGKSDSAGERWHAAVPLHSPERSGPPASRPGHRHLFSRAALAPFIFKRFRRVSGRAAGSARAAAAAQSAALHLQVDYPAAVGPVSG